MAKLDDEIPPVPVPPTGDAVPPVEPPAAATPPVEPSPATPPAPPVADVTVGSPAAPPPPPGYAPPGTGYAPAPAYAAAPAGPPNGLAIAAMVCGIGGLVLSLFGFGFLPAVAAVILGHIAQKKQPYARAFWITGLITGYVGIGISVIFGLIILFFTLASLGTIGYLGTNY